MRTELAQAKQAVIIAPAKNNSKMLNSKIGTKLHARLGRDHWLNERIEKEARPTAVE